MLRDALICGLLWGSSSAAPPGPSRAHASADRVDGAKGRQLKGRFLHITDFHPDPYYKTYSSTAEEAACHRHRGPAGLYGAETSACDSPFSLINQTFQWIDDNIKNEIDFVIWTGDSARHDNDDALPRTQKEVVKQNEFMVSKFADVFGQDGDKWAIPVVPTFGNNDIMPHNIFLAGPNRWTMKYLDIWRSFIPEAQRHQFQQGGWFSVEVIPGKLAVISLNTLYFFTSNSGVDGCANKHEPGYEHMEWLRIQLELFRERGIKAILMGHVPPARVDSKESWDETCWQKYTLWQRQFRDVIVGNLYGHMNIDHFMLQDFEQISKDAEQGRMAATTKAVKSLQEGEIGLYEDGEVTVASASDYLLQLREAWAQLPAPAPKSNKHKQMSWLSDHDGEEDSSLWERLVSTIKWQSKDGKARKDEKRKYLEKIGGKFAQRYSVTHVAPSVVPNYFPTLRVIEYNISGLEHTRIPPSSGHAPPSKHSAQHPIIASDSTYTEEDSPALPSKKHRKSPKKYKFKIPNGPSKSSPPGPAHSPQSLTWTRYTQYFANLTRINNDFVEDSLPFSHNSAAPHTIFGLGISPTGEIDHQRWKEGKHKKHQGKQPRPEPHPMEFAYEVEYDTQTDRGFPDLTVRRWVEYARKIGHERTGKSKSKAKGVEEEDDDEDDEQESEWQLEDGERHTQGKKHKKKKHHHKKKHHKASKEWYTFAKRAFVGTMDPHEIKAVFGAMGAGAQEENLEL